jgi:chromosome segregation ATPase
MSDSQDAIAIVMHPNPNECKLAEAIVPDEPKMLTIEDVEEQFNTLRDALEATNKTFHEIWNRNEILRRQNDSLLKERDESKLKNERSQVEMEELRRNYSTAKQYIDKARAIEEENTKINLELQRMRAEEPSEVLREELRRLQTSVTDLERQLNTSKRAEEELHAKSQELCSMNQALNQSLSEVKEQRDQLAEKCSQLDEALRGSLLERQQSEVERKGIEEELEALKREHEDLQRNYGKLPKISY